MGDQVPDQIPDQVPDVSMKSKDRDRSSKDDNRLSKGDNHLSKEDNRSSKVCSSKDWDLSRKLKSSTPGDARVSPASPVDEDHLVVMSPPRNGSIEGAMGISSIS